MINFVVLCTLHEETIVCYRAQPVVLRIRLGCGCRNSPGSPAVSGPGGGWAAGHPATRIGAGLAFEFRLGAEVVLVMFVSICYCLSGKLACVVSGRPDSV